METCDSSQERGCSAAVVQQADSIKIGLLRRLPPCMQYATQSNIVPEALPIKSAVSFIIAEMFSSTWRKDTDDSSVWGVARRAVCSLC